MCFFVDPSPVRRVPIPTGIHRKLNFVSVRTIKGSSSSHAHGCHIQKTLFPGTYWVHKRTCVLGPFLQSRGLGWRIHGSVEDTKLNTNKQHTLSAGCAGAAWVRGGSLGGGMGAGGRCLATQVGGVRWSGSLLQRRRRLGEVCGRARAGLGYTVSSCGAVSGMRGRLG